MYKNHFFFFNLEYNNREFILEIIMKKKEHNNKRILKACGITVATLTAISTGVVFTASALINHIKSDSNTNTSIESSYSNAIYSAEELHSELEEVEARPSELVASPAPEASNTTSEVSEATTSEVTLTTEDTATLSDAATTTESTTEDTTTSTEANNASTTEADSESTDTTDNSSSNVNTDNSYGEDVTSGKVLPEIESNISGAKVDKLVIDEDDIEDINEPGDSTENNNGNANSNTHSNTNNNSSSNAAILYPASTDATYSVVDGSYFNDAAFIGNSRTEGLLLYTGVNGINLAYTGLNVSTAYSTPAIKVNGTKVSVMEAQKSKTFSKAYIMFGVNEVGWMSGDTFTSYYRKIIQDVRAAHPDAIIYVQSMLPVTANFERERGDITNKKILNFNKRLKKLAKEENAYYLDIANAIADNKGYLPTNSSPDGYHLNQPSCEKWLTFLKEHAIVE